MTQKQFQPIFIFLLILFSCNNNNPELEKHVISPDFNDLADSVYADRDKYFGISLINGKTGGTGFTDSTGATYQFRSLRVRIVNDTTVPANLQMYFSNEPYNFFYSKETKFNAFLIPDTVNGFGKELKVFLNRGLQKSSALSQTLQPGETCSLNIGMLFYTALGRPEGFTAEELSFGARSHRQMPDSIISSKNKNKKNVNIVLDITLHSHATSYTSVSCGEILFTK